jgi:hypothetical protein
MKKHLRTDPLIQDQVEGFDQKYFETNHF